MKINQTYHPCFNADVRHQFGRIHLPVAPKCNIQCNFCNRKFDCVNESRPGVTSAVLSPDQAILYLDEVLGRDPRITVAGIAGPGDPFANPKETMKTIRLIRERFTNVLVCLATNGLNVFPYIRELAELNVSHVTLTMNAVDPEIGVKIYAWVRKGKTIYRGVVGAEVLMNHQLEALAELKKYGITVKINTIVIPGVNDHHVEAIAQKVSELGADFMNCIPVYPTAETAFEKAPVMKPTEIAALREQMKKYVPQMAHCARCRADAVGLLGETVTEKIANTIAQFAKLPILAKEKRPYIGVTSREGVLINLHLGEAESVLIYEKNHEGFRLVETRKTPEPGSGKQRWLELAELLSDCRVLLVNGIGPSPLEVLTEEGIKVIETEGLIEQGLEAADRGAFIPGPRRFVCGSGCKGNGLGCG